MYDLLFCHNLCTVGEHELLEKFSCTHISLLHLSDDALFLMFQRLEKEEKKIIHGGRHRKKFGMPEDYGWEGD